MLKSIFVDHMGNQAFPSLRPKQDPTHDVKENDLFTLRIHNSPIARGVFPRLAKDGEVLPPGAMDSMSDQYVLEGGEYEIQWSEDDTTTVKVEYVGEPPEPRVHFRNLLGMDVSYGNNGGPSALPDPNLIAFPEEA